MSLKVLNREMVGKKIPVCNLFTRYDSIANILKVVINAQDKILFILVSAKDQNRPPLVNNETFKFIDDDMQSISKD